MVSKGIPVYENLYMTLALKRLIVLRKKYKVRMSLITTSNILYEYKTLLAEEFKMNHKESTAENITLVERQISQ